MPMGRSQRCRLASSSPTPAADDEPFVWRLYEGLKAAGFEVWFDRVSMPSRELSFSQEIEDAIMAHDRLVLVVGPTTPSRFRTYIYDAAMAEASTT